MSRRYQSQSFVACHLWSQTYKWYRPGRPWAEAGFGPASVSSTLHVSAHCFTDKVARFELHPCPSWHRWIHACSGQFRHHTVCRDVPRCPAHMVWVTSGRAGCVALADANSTNPACPRHTALLASHLLSLPGWPDPIGAPRYAGDKGGGQAYGQSTHPEQ